MVEGDLGVVFESGAQLPGVGVGRDLAGELDDGSGLGVVEGDVEGEEGVERVVERLGDVGGAGDGVIEQRSVYLDRAEL